MLEDNSPSLTTLCSCEAMSKDISNTRKFGLDRLWPLWNWSPRGEEQREGNHRLARLFPLTIHPSYKEVKQRKRPRPRGVGVLREITTSRPLPSAFVAERS